MHSAIYIRVWGVLQGVISSFPSFWGLWWGISLARWLWQSLSQGTRHCAGTVLGRVAALLQGPQNQPKCNSAAAAKQPHLTGCKVAQLKAPCHSSIWSELCSLRYHTAHGMTGTMSLVNEMQPQAKNIQKKWEDTVPSGHLLQLFSWHLVPLIYGRYKRRWKKIFRVCTKSPQSHFCDSSTGPKKE